MNHRRPLFSPTIAAAALLNVGICLAMQFSAGRRLVAGNDGLSESSAKDLQEKFQALSSPVGRLGPIVVTDREANSYLKFYGRQFLPAGVYNPILHIEPGGVQGTAVVNFDQLNSAEGRNDELGGSLLGLLFRGWQPVTAFGKVETSPGKAKLTIENVKIGETQLNDWLVGWLLQNYVESKYKIDLSRPLNLPPRVTRLTLEPGKAIFDRDPSPPR